MSFSVVIQNLNKYVSPDLKVHILPIISLKFHKARNTAGRVSDGGVVGGGFEVA